MSHYSMHPDPTAQPFPSPILKPIRPPDAAPFVVAGDFLRAGQRDLVIVRGNTLELQSLDTEALDLVPQGRRTLFAAVLGVQAMSIHDASAAGVLDDLDMDLDGEDEEGALAIDDTEMHPLTRARWKGSHVLAVTTNRMVIEIIAVVYNRHGGMSVVPMTGWYLSRSRRFHYTVAHFPSTIGNLACTLLSTPPVVPSPLPPCKTRFTCSGFPPHRPSSAPPLPTHPQRLSKTRSRSARS
ncbi:hypothetical protein BCR44DRAFT_1103189 [Catenaria anguillulae PL171]|uniref:Cleavage/polyadenylation specificity factor A subunit N-terminal domain-containing protein n=1 Tax=Catenaria anguillulae PL171 TaxID=765915 RepID=A0A1Y2I256_9FUNG|nr:hypothetical protein BCR44DRAFT_1103189 [Catenaria anguillulae PL171]